MSEAESDADTMATTLLLLKEAEAQLAAMGSVNALPHLSLAIDLLGREMGLPDRVADLSLLDQPASQEFYSRK